MALRFFHDFYPLWAAGRLTLEGVNPYDNQATISVLEQAGVLLTANPGGFHYPPWTLWLFSLIALWPLPVAIAIWTFVQLGCCYYAVRLIHQLFPVTRFPSSSVKELICLLSFFPLLKALVFGQPTPLILIGILVFIRFQNSRQFIAGLTLGFALITPHLLLALLPFWLLQDFRKGSILTTVGLITAVALQTGVSFILYPDFISGFINEISQLHAERSALPQVTIGHAINLVTGTTWATLALPIIAVCLSCSLAWSRLPRRKLEALLLTLSLLCSPYAFSHDYLLLLPIYLGVCVSLLLRFTSLALAVILLQGVATLLIIGQSLKDNEIYFLWMPISLLAFLLYRLRTDTPEDRIRNDS